MHLRQSKQHTASSDLLYLSPFLPINAKQFLPFYYSVCLWWYCVGVERMNQKKRNHFHSLANEFFLYILSHQARQYLVAFVFIHTFLVFGFLFFFYHFIRIIKIHFYQLLITIFFVHYKWTRNNLNSTTTINYTKIFLFHGWRLINATARNLLI